MYQRTSVSETPEYFANKLISAASNQDLCQKDSRHTRQATSFPVSNTSRGAHEFPPIVPAPDSQLMVLFAETPPHHHFDDHFATNVPTTGFQAHGRIDTNPVRKDLEEVIVGMTTLAHLPHSVLTVMERFFCFGCKMPGQYLRNCPKKQYHQQMFNHYIQIGEAATFLL